MIKSLGYIKILGLIQETFVHTDLQIWPLTDVFWFRLLLFSLMHAVYCEISKYRARAIVPTSQAVGTTV